MEIISESAECAEQTFSKKLLCEAFVEVTLQFDWLLENRLILPFK